MADRICCINPKCRRTAAQDKHPGSAHIICGKCWKAIPDVMRRRWKLLNARSKKFDKLSRKSGFNRPERQPQWQRIEERYDRSWDALILSIIHYFTASEQPIGIEDFLKENGIV